MSAGLLAFIASLPIVAIFVLMVGFRWPATRAMPLAFGLALILAMTVWKTPLNWLDRSSTLRIMMNYASKWVETVAASSMKIAVHSHVCWTWLRNLGNFQKKTRIKVPASDSPAPGPYGTTHLLLVSD